MFHSLNINMDQVRNAFRQQVSDRVSCHLLMIHGASQIINIHGVSFSSTAVFSGIGNFWKIECALFGCDSSIDEIDTHGSLRNAILGQMTIYEAKQVFAGLHGRYGDVFAPGSLCDNGRKTCPRRVRRTELWPTPSNLEQGSGCQCQFSPAKQCLGPIKHGDRRVFPPRRVIFLFDTLFRF